MDILTHTLTGFAAGTVVAGFSSKGWKDKTGIIIFSGFGGALPDIDAISMWSKFDATFGKFFGLAHPGRTIYSEKFWYSHHGFMHSVLAALLFAAVIFLLFYLVGKLRGRTTLKKTFATRKLLLTGFVLGFLLHLVQDMITPASSWGGVRLFFPSEIYVGGTGDIWWWNNYNLFLVVVAVLVINLVLLAVLPRRVKIWKYTTTVFMIGVICFSIGIKQIDYNFNGKKYSECEQQSKEIQQRLLGDNLYRLMVKLDNSMKIYF